MSELVRAVGSMLDTFQGCNEWHEYHTDEAQQIVSFIREQIAKEIESWHESSASYHKDFDHCDCLKILAIARGQK